MKVSEFLSEASLQNVRVGIGCAHVSEYVEASVRTADSPNVTIYHDSQALVDDLASGKIDAAIRGDFSSSKLLPQLKKSLGVKGFERLAIFEFEGRVVFLAPVGVDEGHFVDDRVDMAERAAALWEKVAGSKPKIAVMSGARCEDRGRCDIVDDTIDNALAVVDKLVENGRDAYHAQILIEDALEDADIIIPPNGIAGNLIFRTIHFIGGVPTLGAPILNSDKVFIDTSRRMNDYVQSIFLAAKIVEVWR